MSAYYNIKTNKQTKSKLTTGSGLISCPVKSSMNGIGIFMFPDVWKHKDVILNNWISFTENTRTTHRNSCLFTLYLKFTSFWKLPHNIHPGLFNRQVCTKIIDLFSVMYSAPGGYGQECLLPGFTGTENVSSATLSGKWKWLSFPKLSLSMSDSHASPDK